MLLEQGSRLRRSADGRKGIMPGFGLRENLFVPPLLFAGKTADLRKALDPRYTLRAEIAATPSAVVAKHATPYLLVAALCRGMVSAPDTKAHPSRRPRCGASTPLAQA